MPDEMNKLARDFMEQVIFKHRVNESDALVLFNWFIDHHSTKVYRHKNGFLTLCYCGRCSTIVGEGDKYCSQCGRYLRWN